MENRQVLIDKKLIMKIKVLVLIILVLCTTGCGVSFYSTTNQNQNQTSVVLSENNFRIVKTVSAEVSCSYVFGIGGLSKNALMSNAISELTKKAHMTGAQALINVTVKTHNKVILIWARRSMVAQGTVIEFVDNSVTLGNTDEVYSASVHGDVHEDVENMADKPLVDIFSDNIIDEKSEFEANQIAEKFCDEISNDIKNSDIKTAREKLSILEQWFNQQPKKNKSIGKYIDRLKSRL